MSPVLAASSEGGSAFGLLFPLLLVAIFFFLIIRPQRARQRAAQQVRASLAPGAQVMTTSGIFGTVQAMDDEAVTIEVAPGVPVRFLRGAVARVVTPQVGDTAEIPPDDRPPA